MSTADGPTDDEVRMFAVLRRVRDLEGVLEDLKQRTHHAERVALEAACYREFVVKVEDAWLDGFEEDGTFVDQYEELRSEYGFDLEPATES